MPQPPEERSEPSVSGQAGLILGARLLSALSTAGLTVILARVLGSDDFGAYALALAVAATVGLLADLGIADSLGRYVADSLTRGRDPGAVLVVGLRVKLITSAVVFGALIASADAVEALLGVDGLANLVRIAAVAAFCGELFASASDVLIALRRGGPAAGMTLVKAGVEFVAVVSMILLGLGASGALAGNALGFLAGALLGLGLVAPMMVRARAARSEPIVGTRRLVGYGVHIWVATIAWEGFERVDQLLLGALRGAEAVAQYEAAWRFAAFLAIAGTAAGAAVGPRMASPPDIKEAGDRLARWMRAAIVTYVPLAAVTAAVAIPLVPAVLGEDFRRGGVVLAVLLPYVAVLGVAPLLSNTLDFAGAGSVRKWLALGALTLNVVLDLILIPRLGVVGPAIATNLAVLFYVGGIAVVTGRRIPIGWRRTAGAIVPAVAAGAAGAAVAVGMLLGLGSSLGIVAAAYAIGLMASGATLVGFGEIDPREALARIRERGA